MVKHIFNPCKILKSRLSHESVAEAGFDGGFSLVKGSLGLHFNVNFVSYDLLSFSFRSSIFP